MREEDFPVGFFIKIGTGPDHPEMIDKARIMS
jgi:hypothetical protein